MPEPRGTPGQASPRVPWAEVWRATADAMAAHLQAGREHLLTEDVLRFSLARALEDAGVDPGRLRVEHRVAEIGAIDLVIETPPVTAVEIKYPRDPEGSGAGDTMIHGELVADLYRLVGLAPTPRGGRSSCSTSACGATLLAGPRWSGPGNPANG